MQCHKCESNGRPALRVHVCSHDCQKRRKWGACRFGEKGLASLIYSMEAEAPIEAKITGSKGSVILHDRAHNPTALTFTPKGNPVPSHLPSCLYLPAASAAASWAALVWLDLLGLLSHLHAASRSGLAHLS